MKQSSALALALAAPLLLGASKPVLVPDVSARSIEIRYSFTGAQLLLSDEGGEQWRYKFAEGANARLLHDGDVITATIASPDGRLDLGTQHNTIIGKTP